MIDWSLIVNLDENNTVVKMVQSRATTENMKVMVVLVIHVHLYREPNKL